MLADPVFWTALGNSLLFALVTVPLIIAIAMAMALWVNSRIGGRGLLRLAYFTPTILPMIAVANLWLFFYTPVYRSAEHRVGNGLVNTGRLRWSPYNLKK